ncbi:MAG: hypothetical protein JSR91_14175 [Proteobacteria bacterium]|nr:hypothetical protein [Pseudomonadota bacterium]
MIRFRSVAAIAAGSLLAAAAVYAAQPYSSSAQDRAEKTCRDYGVTPNSSIWELCLSHVTRAYEWDEPALARQLANTAGNAQGSCRDQGYDTGSSGYRACVNREMEARSHLEILGDDRSGENVAQAQ